MTFTKHFIAACAALFLSAQAHAAVTTGEAAPAFTAVDALSNKNISLADLKGKTVVLEWTNYGCPFVKKHYNVNNMQTLQKAATADGVVWVSVNSGGKGKQGYLEADEVADAVKKQGAASTHYIRDPEGALGKLYGAKTTPHIFIINAKGTLVYQGAIDDNSSHESSSIPGATNYVTQTLAALKAGKPVATGTTQPYGCSVKYAN